MSAIHGDARLETALCALTLDELGRLQETVLELLRDELPSSTQIARAIDTDHHEVAAWFRFRQADDAVKALMLLGALAVAIAWLEHRHMPAPAGRLADVVARVDEGHLYMLPIPRTADCFCGSRARFKSCHGKPPVAVPAV